MISTLDFDIYVKMKLFEEWLEWRIPFEIKLSLLIQNKEFYKYISDLLNNPVETTTFKLPIFYFTIKQGEGL